MGTKKTSKKVLGIRKDFDDVFLSLYDIEIERAVKKYIDSFIKIFSCVNGLHIKAIGRENDTGISFGNGTDVIKTLWILFELLQVEQDESKGDQLFGCADGKGRGEKN